MNQEQAEKEYRDMRKIAYENRYRVMAQAVGARDEAYARANRDYEEAETVANKDYWTALSEALKIRNKALQQD